MKILRTRENGRPHPRAKEKLGSLSHSFRVTVPFSFSFPSSLRLSLSLSYSPLSLSFSLFSRHERARASTDTYYMDADVGGENWWAGAAEGRLIPVPRGSRSAPHLREGAAASQTFRAETRFLTGNFVRLRSLPPTSATAASSSAVRSSLEFFEFSRCTHGQSCLSRLYADR